MRERYDRGAEPGTWCNRLVRGDNLAMLRGWAKAGGPPIDLVYIDPPYLTGVAYLASRNEGSRHARAAYSDVWEGGVLEYLAHLQPRVEAIYEALSPTGSLFVHVGWQVNAHVRLLLDRIFGADKLVDEIIWRYQTSSGAPGAALIKNHATIFHYARGDRWVFNQLREPWPERTLRKWQRDEDGRIYRVQNKFGKKYYIDPEGKRIDDVWEFTLASRSHERTLYPTQKPEALLERIVRMASNPGDLVADFYCGSGTTLAVAERLGRRWVGCDASPYAVQTTRKRLLGVSGRRVFEIVSDADTDADADADADTDADTDADADTGADTDTDAGADADTDTDTDTDTAQDAGLVVYPALRAVPGGIVAALTGVRYQHPERLPDRFHGVSPTIDLIDEWAVDWDYDGSVFRPHWWACRTRKTPDLAPISAEQPGASGIVRIRAVDIFGHEADWVGLAAELPVS